MHETTIPDHGAFAAYGSDLVQGGLTKREYFAAQALQGMAANASVSLNYSYENMAKDAVGLADVLIEVLNK